MTAPVPTPPVTPDEPTPAATPDPEAPTDSTTDPWDDPKAARREIEKLRKENGDRRIKLREYEPRIAELDKITAERQTAEEKATAALAKAEERATAATTRAVRSEIRALAADLFADPGDPADNLNVAKYVSGDGEIDTDGIKTDLADLLKRKPHWGKTDPAAPRSPKPDRSQGSSAQGQVSVEAQIAEAQAKGDIARVIRLQTQKLFQPQQR